MLKLCGNDCLAHHLPTPFYSESSLKILFCYFFRPNIYILILVCKKMKLVWRYLS